MGDNAEEVLAFCGADPLGNPAADISREWNPVFGKETARLTIYNDVHHTTYPVRIGETIVRGVDGLRPMDTDTYSYERRHEGEEG